MFVGCSGGQGESPVPAPIQAPPTAPMRKAETPPPKEPEFNNTDLDETFRWAFKRAKYFRDNEGKAKAAVSANALNDEEWRKFQGEVEAFRDELNEHVGETVAWQARVKEITSKGVVLGCSFDQKFAPTLSRPFLGFRLDVKFAGGNQFNKYGTWGESTLPLNTSISRAYAKTLRPGDVITVEGTLAECEFGGIYEDKYHDSALKVYVEKARVEIGVSSFFGGVAEWKSVSVHFSAGWPLEIGVGSFFAFPRSASRWGG